MGNARRWTLTASLGSFYQFAGIEHGGAWPGLAGIVALWKV